MKDEEIVERIKSFPYWHYPFNLKGHKTPLPKNLGTYARFEKRAFKRRRYILDPIVKLYGGSLKGKRLLDLGCNSGFWSLCAIEEGADFVLGIDARPMFIEQANFVFEVKEIDKSKYKFISANIFDVNLLEYGPFDIVLCLGLLYHVNKPIALLEKIAEANDDILVIDTRISNGWGSCLKVVLDYEGPDSYVDSKVVMLPTRRAIFDIVKQFGYSVVMLKPPFTDYEGVWDYRWERRAFLCAKKTDLSKLPRKLIVDIHSPREYIYDLLHGILEIFKFLKKCR